MISFPAKGNIVQCNILTKHNFSKHNLMRLVLGRRCKRSQSWSAMNVMQPLLMSFPTDMSSYIIESNANMATAIHTKSIFCTLGTAANSFW